MIKKIANKLKLKIVLNVGSRTDHQKINFFEIIVKNVKKPHKIKVLEH
tara:strand:- start:300 stop:443 length:144 start_codon:yes stop_codon:yes gene_type:complete